MRERVSIIDSVNVSEGVSPRRTERSIKKSSEQVNDENENSKRMRIKRCKFLFLSIFLSSDEQRIINGLVCMESVKRLTFEMIRYK